MTRPDLPPAHIAAPVGAAMPGGRSAAAVDRVAAVDALRGLIMIVMAIDHASYFIAKVHPGEFWGTPLPRYPGALAFLTRFVTHFCAPGFFFLMGVSVTLYVAARRRNGVPDARITRRLLVRGALLIVLEHVLENPAWLLGSIAASVPIETHGGSRPPGTGGEILLGFLVLYGLGGAMILCALLARLPTVAVLGLSAAAFTATQLVLPGPEHIREPYSALTRLLLIPGQTGSLFVAYPLLPWLAIAALGLAFGRLLLEDRRRGERLAMGAGALCLVLFTLLRATGSGDPHGLTQPGWMGWFALTKYPPSVAFALLTVGGNLVLLGLLAQAGAALERVGRPLLVFGSSALFFYFAHLYLYALLGFGFPAGTTLAWMYPVWALGLVLLYPACAWYGRFKRRQAPESLWRLF